MQIPVGIPNVKKNLSKTSRILLSIFILIQSINLFGQKEFVSPDGIKKVTIENPTENRYRVVVNSSPQNYYEQIVNQKVYFFTDSYSVLYIAKCVDGYCIVVDGVEQPHYKEIINNRITFSPDRSHYAYMGLIKRGLVNVEICYVIDGKEQTHYDNLSANGIVFSPDSKHWAYAALQNNKWFFVIDGVKQSDYNQVSFANLEFSPDSKHWKYQAEKNSKWIYIVDGKESSSNSFEPENIAEKNEENVDTINNITEEQSGYQKKETQLNYKGNLFCLAFDPVNFIFSGPTLTGELTLQKYGSNTGFGIFSGYRFIKWGWMARDLLWDDLKTSSYTIPIAFRIYTNAIDKTSGRYIGPYAEFGKLRYNEGDNEYIRAFGFEYGLKYIWDNGLTFELSVIFGRLKYGTPDDWMKMWYPALSCKLGYTF